ncbi:MAG: C10 family peptidase [Muribaculum sp.]|nr:C10 family peptidase [Muribaculum sp.]
MNKIVILAVLAGSVMPAMAWQRSESDMLKVARQTLQAKQLNIDSPVKKLLQKDMISVYGADQGGYVVLSSSPLVSPVIGYSDKKFDAADIPSGLAWWIETVNSSLTSGEYNMPRANESGTPVSPLCSTHWAQEHPFNSKCPKISSMWGSSNTMTGCVATAMAQVMKYYNYPAQSTGTGYYSTDQGNSFKEAKMSTNYQWDKMLDRYHFNYTQEQSDAVAELMRDCGYASKMIYTEQGSGANLYDAAYGLAHVMQYDSLSMRVRTRAYYTNDEWMAMVNKELRENRPILYAATDPDRLAHSFVLDGLDANGFVHVNWGWSGDADGYYDLSIAKGLNPSYPNPYTGGKEQYHFTTEQIMVTGLRPDPKPAEDAEYESTFVGYNIPDLMFQDDSLLISQTPIFNMSHLNFKGLLGLVIEGEDGHAVVQPFFYSAWDNNAIIPVLGGVYITEEYYPSGTLCETDLKTPRPDGKYYLYFISWSEEEMANGWMPRDLRFPVADPSQHESLPAKWTANIVNGHWDPSSLKQYFGESGVTPISATYSDAPAKVYTIDGHEITLDAAKQTMKGQPVIIVKDGISSKVIF